MCTNSDHLNKLYNIPYVDEVRILDGCDILFGHEVNCALSQRLIFFGKSFFIITSIRCADWRAITLSRWSRDSMCRTRVDVRKFVAPDVNVFFFINALHTEQYISPSSYLSQAYFISQTATLSGNFFLYRLFIFVFLCCILSVDAFRCR